MESLHLHLMCDVCRVRENVSVGVEEIFATKLKRSIKDWRRYRNGTNFIDLCSDKCDNIYAKKCLHPDM